ncbi:MAG: CoA-binding protein [Promethearchaeota archaeon]
MSEREKMNGQSILEKINPFFDPKSVVIIGASRNEYTFNGILLKNLLEVQYKGKIYIVHPYTDIVMGIPCVNNLEDLFNNGAKPELAIILTQKNLLQTLKILGEKEIKHILIEVDFSQKLGKNEQIILDNSIKKIISEYDLKVLGPSMIGLIDFQHLFTSSIIPTRSHIVLPNRKEKPQRGASFMAQSGGLTGACGWWAPDQAIPLAKIIHIGKAIDISEAEMLEYLFEDPHTQIILLYLKEIPEEYNEVLSKYKNKKPILYKYVGKPSKTEQKFKEQGANSVDNYIELFEFAKVFLWSPPPLSNAVGIIGPSSGAINLIISEMRNQEIHLANLDEENRRAILENVGGSTCELGNPVDYWPPKEFIGTQVCRVYHQASNTLLKDPQVSALFLALEFFTEIEFNFTIFETIKEKYPNKPIICVLIQAEREGGSRILEIGTRLQIPVFINEIERAVKSLKFLLDFYKIKNGKNG